MYEFLSVDDVLLIHQHQIDRFGGATGVRDFDLLESALAQPPMTFGDQFLHQDVFEMASAYLFHLTSNHPFIDGNKRIGLACALIFLDLNGVLISTGTDQLYVLTMEVAQGRKTKEEIALCFKELHQTQSS